MSKPLTYGSVCSGIEAASVAWHPLGWRAAFVSEIEAFPRAVLQHRWPEAPLHGDFTTIEAGDYAPINLLVGGTPCQDFSVAGLRAGMAGDRGNLTLQFLTLARRLRPKWVVWENVPGVLSSAGGRDFGAFLGGLGELGYGWAYRTLDAQFFGVAQRRRRVFVVGHLGDWRRAAAVLFERHSLSGHPSPSRQAGERPTGTLAGGARRNGGYSHDDIPAVAGTLNANGKAAGSATQQDAEQGNLIAWQATGNSFWREGLGPLGASDDNGTNQLVCFSSKDHGADAELDLSPTLRAGGHHGSHAAGVPPAIAYGLRSDAHRSGEARTPSADAEGRVRLRDAGFNPLEECAPTLDAGAPHAVAFALRGREGGAMPELGGDHVGSLRAASGGSSRDYVAFAPTVSATLAARSSRGGGQTNSPGHNADQQIVATSAVRRLTPRECERLQGFPDDYTLIPWRNGVASDGPRYKALGNSMAVPVMRWIGERIAQVEALQLASTSPHFNGEAA